MSVKAFTFISVLLVSTLCVAAFPGTLYFAADGTARAYRNGLPIGTLNNPTGTKTVNIPNLQPGDMLAIVAKNLGGNYGVIADLDLGSGGHCVTQVSGGHWRAVAATPTTSFTRTMPSYFTSGNDCRALAEPTKANIDVNSLNFPFGNGASYVWAPSAAEQSEIHLCLEVSSSCS